MWRRWRNSIQTHSHQQVIQCRPATRYFWQNRGHDVVLGTNLSCEQKIQSLGLGFHPIRPDCDWLHGAEKVRWFSHPRFGLLRVGRGSLRPALCDAYEDTLAAAQGADLLVTMIASYATRLVAEKEGIPQVSAVHTPVTFVLAYDPPILEISPFLSKWLRLLGPLFWRIIFGVGRRVSRSLSTE